MAIFCRPSSNNKKPTIFRKHNQLTVYTYSYLPFLHRLIWQILQRLPFTPPTPEKKGGSQLEVLFLKNNPL